MGRPIRNSEALQAVKWGIVVRAQESCAQGEGPEGEGRARVHRSPAHAVRREAQGKNVERPLAYRC